MQLRQEYTEQSTQDNNMKNCNSTH